MYFLNFREWFGGLLRSLLYFGTSYEAGSCSDAKLHRTSLYRVMIVPDWLGKFRYELKEENDTCSVTVSDLGLDKL